MCKTTTKNFKYLEQHLQRHCRRTVDSCPLTQVTIATLMSKGDRDTCLLDLVALVRLFQVDHEFFNRIWAAQQADNSSQEIITSLKNSTAAPSSEFRTLYAVRYEFLGVPEADGSWRLVIPDGTLGPSVLTRYFHDEAGQPGVQRTLLAIARYFYWPNMSRFITQYISSFTECQAAKASNWRPAG
jgi:hypothetical protein